MYTFFKLMPLRRLLFEQAPSLATALFCAEWFYKFHSFTVECVAFLATWYVIDAVRSTASDAITAQPIAHPAKEIEP